MALKNQNRADPFLILFGSGFSGIGSIIVLVGLLAQQDMQSRLIFALVGLLAMLIGGSILFFVTRFANRRFRILRQGRVREGIIEQFNETVFVNGNQRVFQAKIRLSGDTNGQLITTRVQGIPVGAARSLHESGKTTRVLQDPDDESRIMLIDCMAI